MRVLVLGLVLAMAAAAPANGNADDQQIAEFIKAKLLQEKQRGNLFGFNVDMRVDKGTVWFKGFVSNRSQELMILRTAQLAGHLGVVQVVDDIDVNGPFAQNAPQPPVPPQAVQQQQQVMTSVPVPRHVQQMPQMQAQQPAMVRPTTMPQRAQQPMPGQAAPASPAPAPMQQMIPQRQPMPAPMQRPTAATESPSDTQRVAYQEPVMGTAMSPMQHAPMQMQQPPMGYGQTEPSFQQALTSPMEGQVYSQPMPMSSMPEPAAPASCAPAQSMGMPGTPLPFATSSTAVEGCGAGGCGGMDGGMVGGMVGGMGGPMAGGGGFGAGGGAGMSGGAANLPGYAWPAYAAHPNYGAVSYPKQYSPSAWPYIGPFYPYPQVPLGWRKVALEWDDGWWYLDFHDKD